MPPTSPTSIAGTDEITGATPDREASGRPASGIGDPGDDIRLLGRLIGDVLREQAGDNSFELVERVRLIAVQSRRAGESPIGELTDTLSTASVDEQLHVIRAFGWLSLLANTAEDIHQERRRRDYRDTGSGSRSGSLAASLTKLLAGGVPVDR
ncbi:MAG: phosphoenolpyruvate carboxylase, partial [Ilumatobacteraceae bacterium]